MKYNSQSLRNADIRTRYPAMKLLALVILTFFMTGIYAQTSFYTGTGSVDGVSTGNNGVGVGIQNTLSSFHVSADGVVVNSDFNTNDIMVVSRNAAALGITAIVASNNTAHRGVFKATRARGTLGSPVIPNNNDLVMSFLAGVYDGFTNGGSDKAVQGTSSVDFFVDGAVSNNIAPSRIAFSTSTTTSLSRVERLRIRADGDIEIPGIAGPGIQMVTVAADGTLGSAPISGGGAHGLTDHTDVNLAAPANGDVLAYDGTEWVNTGNDFSTTNELQNLGLTSSGTNRTVTINGGTNATFSIADNDNNSSNEIQSLSLTGNTLALSGDGNVSLASYMDNTDAQTLSYNSATSNLSISGGNTVNIMDQDWEFDNAGEVNLVNDNDEVHIGVDWGGPLVDKVWVRALDTAQHVFRGQIAPGITKFRMTNNGGMIIGSTSTEVKDNSFRVVQDGSFGGGASGNARLDVGNTEGIDRDTLIFVDQNSSNTSGVHYGVRVNNNPSTTTTAYGYYHERLGGANGTRYGYRSYMSGGTGTRYGFSSSLYADVANTNTVYGLYSYVSSSATTGSSYAGYFSNGTGTNKWAVYAAGDSYFSSDVRIASTQQAAGYELSVNGQIACEELLIDDSGSWPDYVFEDDYELMSLDAFKLSIEANNHLPGLPSAKEVEENGILSGEMHKMTMEKVEELSLYIIELHERLKQTETKVNVLEQENTELKANLIK